GAGNRRCDRRSPLGGRGFEGVESMAPSAMSKSVSEPSGQGTEARDEAVRAALADAKPLAYWLDDPARPEPEPELRGDTHCDLLVVGGGYSGLWTALIAKERDPAREVVL